MLLKQIEYFTAVIKYNSFTEAAEKCYISQSAISQQIKALEEELGVLLLKRENRKFSLTPAGEYFYRQGLILLDEADRIKKETIQIGNYDDEHLKIGYLKCYKGYELYQAVAEFSEIYPEVTLEIVNGSHEELYDLLRFGGVDLVLNDQRRAFSEEYNNVQLITSRCFIEISKRSPLSSFDNVTLNDLKKIPCIIAATKEQQENEKDFYQRTLGFNGEFIFVENSEEGHLLVIANKGFMPVECTENFALTEQNNTKYISLLKNEEPIKRNYCAFWKKYRSDYYIEEFVNILNRIFSENFKNK